MQVLLPKEFVYLLSLAAYFSSYLFCTSLKVLLRKAAPVMPSAAL